MKPLMIVGLIAVALIYGCQPESDSKSIPSPYFKTNEFIEKDFKKMIQSKSFKRIITLNGEVDSLGVEVSYTEREYALLTHFDLSNPKWIGKFDADTVYGLYGDPEKLIYQTLDPDLPVKSLEVILNQGNIVEIKGYRETKSLINKHFIAMSYFPGHGYTLDSKQATWTGDTMRLIVQTKFE